MNTTMPESEYQDVEELSVKLRGERKLNSDKNTRIAELEEQIGKQIDFIMAFESEIDGGYKGQYIIQRVWRELKAQHLNDNGE